MYDLSLTGTGLVVSCLVDIMSPEFTVSGNITELAAVNASPPFDTGHASVPYCSIVVQHMNEDIRIDLGD